MDTSTGITPVMPVGGFGDGFGGNSFVWIFGLLILLGLFNGGFGYGGGGNSNAIQADVNRGFDNQNLQAQTRDILGAVTNGTAQSVAATNQSFHDSLAAMQSLYNETARDIAALAVGQANLLANQSNCCCETRMLVQQTAADNALAMAQMEARLTAKMDANEITSLRDQIQQLQLAQATCGMLRFPTSWTYAGGVFPPVSGTTTTG